MLFIVIFCFTLSSAMYKHGEVTNGRSHLVTSICNVRLALQTTVYFIKLIWRTDQILYWSATSEQRIVIYQGH